MSNTGDFIKDCIAGITTASNIDDYIDGWHNSSSPQELHQYLGMSLDEYGRFVKDESALIEIIAEHKKAPATPQPRGHIKLSLYYNTHSGLLCMCYSPTPLQDSHIVSLGAIHNNTPRFLAFNWLLSEYIQHRGKIREAHQIRTLYNRFVIEYKAGNFPAYAGWLIGAITQKPYMHEIPQLTSFYHITQPITKLFTKHFPSTKS